MRGPSGGRATRPGSTHADTTDTIQLVAVSEYNDDLASRPTSIVHDLNGTLTMCPDRTYGFDYNPANRINAFTSAVDGTSSSTDDD